MVAYPLAFYGSESAGTHMQREFAALNAGLGKGLEQARGEVESCGGGGYRAFDFGIYSLIVSRITLLRITIEIRGYGDVSGSFDYRGERQSGGSPGEDHLVAAVGQAAAAASGEGSLGAVGQAQSLFQRLRFPLLEITHQASPGARAGSGKGAVVVAREKRLEAEDFYGGSGGLAHGYAGVDYTSVVAHEQRARGEQRGELGEDVMRGIAPLTYGHETTGVARLAGMGGNARRGQRIVIILYPDV